MERVRGKQNRRKSNRFDLFLTFIPDMFHIGFVAEPICHDLDTYRILPKFRISVTTFDSHAEIKSSLFSVFLIGFDFTTISN